MATIDCLQQTNQYDDEGTHCFVSASKPGKDGICSIGNARKHQANTDRNVSNAFFSFHLAQPILIEKEGAYYWNTQTAHLTEFLKGLLYPKHSFW